MNAVWAAAEGVTAPAGRGRGSSGPPRAGSRVPAASSVSVTAAVTE